VMWLTTCITTQYFLLDFPFLDQYASPLSVLRRGSSRSRWKRFRPTSPTSVQLAHWILCPYGLLEVVGKMDPALESPFIRFPPLPCWPRSPCPWRGLVELCCFLFSHCTLSPLARRPFLRFFSHCSTVRACLVATRVLMACFGEGPMQGFYFRTLGHFTLSFPLPPCLLSFVRSTS